MLRSTKPKWSEFSPTNENSSYTCTLFWKKLMYVNFLSHVWVGLNITDGIAPQITWNLNVKCLALGFNFNTKPNLSTELGGCKNCAYLPIWVIIIIGLGVRKMNEIVGRSFTTFKMCFLCLFRDDIMFSRCSEVHLTKKL